MEKLARIELLEKQLRVMRRSCIACAVIVFIGITIAMTKESDAPSIISAHKFVVIDADGNQIASIAEAKDGGGRLALQDTNGKTFASISSDSYGRGKVFVNNKEGKPRVILSNNTVGGSIKVYNPSGGQLAGIGGNLDSNGSFWLWRESDGMPLCTILSSGKGAGKVATYNMDGLTSSIPAGDNQVPTDTSHNK